MAPGTMIPRVTRLLVLAGLLGVLVSGCAGRGERADRPTSEAPAEAAVEVPATPAAPTVPPVLRCTVDTDCRLSQFPAPVDSVAGCYCPECPRPMAGEVASVQEAQWQRWCAGEWQRSRRCLAPMCPPPPGAPACVAGRCGYDIAS
jgi:hypothetical protein